MQARAYFLTLIFFDAKHDTKISLGTTKKKFWFMPENFKLVYAKTFGCKQKNFLCFASKIIDVGNQAM